MNARLIVLAAMFATATAAVAQPTNPPAPAAKAAKPPVQVVLASADNVRVGAPTADQPVAAPVKRRAARVTSCRCGDPQPAEQQQQ